METPMARKEPKKKMKDEQISMKKIQIKISFNSSFDWSSNPGA